MQLMIAGSQKPQPKVWDLCASVLLFCFAESEVHNNFFDF